MKSVTLNGITYPVTGSGERGETGFWFTIRLFDGREQTYTERDMAELEALGVSDAA